MADVPGTGESEGSEKEREKLSERAQAGEGKILDEDGLPLTRTTPTFGTVDLPLKSPLLPTAPLPIGAGPIPTSSSAYDPTQRRGSSSITSFINYSSATRPRDLSSTSRRPSSPPKSHSSVSSTTGRSQAFKFPPPPPHTAPPPSAHTAPRSTTSDLPLPPHSFLYPGSFPSPVIDTRRRSESHHGFGGSTGRQRDSPTLGPSRRPLTQGESSRGFGHPSESPSFGLPFGAEVRASSEAPPPFSVERSPLLRERERAAHRRTMSSGPSRSARREIPSRGASQAWFSLGPMEAVDMRQWGQEQRHAYQRGHSDALEAVQRGTMGVGGDQYPLPKLLRMDEVLPTEEDYPAISTRRPSLTDATRSFYPEASARFPPTGSSHESAATPYPFPQYPPSQSQNHHPHYQSTSAWADDRRAEYARYEYTVPPPSHNPGSSLPGPSIARGPYYPGLDARAHTFVDNSTYTSNPTTTTTAATSPGQATRPGQRQLISCYPCRMRKMKCDGTKPCFQCVRRGRETECHFAVTVRRRGKGKKQSTGGASTGRSASASDAEGEMESGQESGDERWRMEGMNLPDVGEET